MNDRKIPYCEDSSNEKIDYLRNRIRLELIPFLREKYNPRITENLFEASGIFRADNDYLKALEDQEFDRVFSRSGAGLIPPTPLRPLPRNRFIKTVSTWSSEV